MSDEREGKLHDAATAAAARDKTALETGKASDNRRAVVAIMKVWWRLIRDKKSRKNASYTLT